MVDTTQFAGMIGPNNLLDQVRTTAPFLFESELAASLREEHIDRLIHAGDGPHGYLRILVHGEKN